jgi:hypothetical protein
MDTCSSDQFLQVRLALRVNPPGVNACIHHLDITCDGCEGDIVGLRLLEVTPFPSTDDLTNFLCQSLADSNVMCVTIETSVRHV